MKNLSDIVICESVYTPIISPEDILYPPLQYYDKNYLKVSEIHNLWYAQYGNPKGVPVIVIHGGPGFGCGLNDMRYFDPSYYRIILFDQRGTKRSIPLGEIKNNNTQTLITDIEKLREHLSIEKWVIFGGSWGSTLGMLYGEFYPKRCLGFVLRSIFLATKEECLQIWYGIQNIFPEVWDELQGFVQTEEKHDLIEAYYKRVMDQDPRVHMPSARTLMKCNQNSMLFQHNPELINKLIENDAFVLSYARIFTNYFKHNFFIKENEILKNLKRIQHLPAIIVQGRYDIVCNAKIAYRLHQCWKNSRLNFVQDAGHSAFEPGMIKALLESTEKIKTFLKKSN